MSNKAFHFKQFKVEQDQCAMKIGTDGVLLGAWASIKNANTILDVGAGTGVIALMLAQRSTAEIIDAVELNPDAYQQCVENFEASPWNDRLFCYHASFQEFYEEMDEPYDVIVSNPPFHDETIASTDTHRNQARATRSLPSVALLKGVFSLLAEKGTFCTVIPAQKAPSFIASAEKNGLHLTQQVLVRGKHDAPVKRHLLAFSTTPASIITDELVLEKERHVYTDAYQDLLKDFLLKL